MIKYNYYMKITQLFIRFIVNETMLLKKRVKRREKEI